VSMHGYAAAAVCLGPAHVPLISSLYDGVGWLFTIDDLVMGRREGLLAKVAQRCLIKNHHLRAVKSSTVL